MGWSTPIIVEQYDPEWQKKFTSPIPPHLTPEEKQQWEKELEWEKQQLEQRKKEGFYKYPD
jgi:carbamate kinase